MTTIGTNFPASRGELGHDRIRPSGMSRASSNTPGNPAAVGVQCAIDIGELAALLSPALPSVEHILTYQRHDFVPDGSRGLKVLPVEHELFLYDHRGRLGFSAGLVPRVTAHIKALGGTVRITDHREFGPQHHIDAAVVQAATTAEQELLQVLVRESLGQIALAGRKDIVKVIALISRAFPDARIVIAAASRRRVYALWRSLRDILGNTVHLYTNGTKAPWARIVVSTYAFLWSLNWQGIDVLLLPDAADAAGDGRREILGNISTTARRVYSLITPELRLAPVEQLCLEALSGPVIYSTTPKAAAVNVILADGVSFPRVEQLEGLERKRVAYWNNTARNDAIVAIAQALAHRNIPQLWSLGLLKDGPQEVLPLGDHPPYIVILVECTEHGRELLKRLPGWELLRGANREVLEIGDPADARTGTIGTVLCAANCDINADIMIYAGAGCFRDLPGFPPPRDRQPGGRIVLIDLADDFDGKARQDAQRRLNNYVGWGWTITNAPRWLQDRPGGHRTGLEDTAKPGIGKAPDEPRTPALPTTQRTRVGNAGGATKTEIPRDARGAHTESGPTPRPPGLTPPAPTPGTGTRPSPASSTTGIIPGVESPGGPTPGTTPPGPHTPTPTSRDNLSGTGTRGKNPLLLPTPPLPRTKATRQRVSERRPMDHT